MNSTDAKPMPHASSVGLRAGGPATAQPELGTLRRVDSPVLGPARPGSAAFVQQLERAQSSLRPGASDVVVQRGDTLTSLVRGQWAAQGGRADELSPGQAHRWALQVARDNGLSNPDLIVAGQRLAINSPPTMGPSTARLAQPSVQALAHRSREMVPAREVASHSSGNPSASPGAPAQSATSPPALPPVASIVRVQPPLTTPLLHPLLNQTLDRAVDLGFIPAPERGQVHNRINELALKHGFKPDDFARAVLMESNGLNPRATNGQCHGIIQFCSGPDRGAASAGYAQRPQAILDLSVLRQLDLVDRYFDDTRLRDFRGRDGQVRLDDLYLTILTPAARQERRLSAPLPIAGPQALDLHVGRDRQSPITRSSILAGLHANARLRLGSFTVASLNLD